MRTNLRQQIALIEKGSGLVRGVTSIKDVLPPLDYQGMIDASHFHGIPDNLIGIVYERGWRVPWVLGRVHPLDEPVRYTHPKGCVTWVRLTNLESQQVLAASPL